MSEDKQQPKPSSDGLEKKQDEEICGILSYTHPPEKVVPPEKPPPSPPEKPKENEPDGD